MTCVKVTLGQIGRIGKAYVGVKQIKWVSPVS